MKLHPLKIIVIALFLVTVSNENAIGQTYKMKFGDIDISDLEMTKYENDTSASAVVLGDFGEASFTYYQNDGGFKIVFKRHMRIKIFKKDGYDWANHQLRLYTSGGVDERMGQVKGNTYNLVNGKIEVEKLTKKSQFVEKESDNWNLVKFAMPNVKEGSIIELSYEYVSPYIFNLPEWYFQYSIPVKWSELNVAVPEYFQYRLLMSGYEPLVVNDQTTGSSYINIKTKGPRADRYDLKPTEISSEEIQFKTSIYRMVAKDVPSFIEEPMLTTRDNYISRIKFELALTRMPGTQEVLYTDTWESINKKLIDNEDFGGQLSGGNFLNEDIEKITLSYPGQMDRLVAVYDFMKNHMKWNGNYGKYAEGNLRNAYNDRSGNVGDINLMLVLALRKAGFTSNPVVLSTRQNGIVNPHFPLLSTFNYVIAYVNLDGKTYLLDATDPLCTVGLLPERCLNGNGRLVSETSTDWVELNQGRKYIYTSSLNLSLDEAGLFTGNISNIREDYAAYSLRKMINSEASEEDFIKKVESSFNGLKVENFKCENRENLYQPVKEEYDIVISDNVEDAGNIIYFNPMFYERVESNPFRLKERKYPIDYSFPYSEKYVLNLEIPEGYEVDELPSSVKAALPDNSASFNYNATIVDGKIRVVNEFMINKTLFVFDEYEVLKEFYNLMVEKHAEQVVLKKTD